MKAGRLPDRGIVYLWLDRIHSMINVSSRGSGRIVGYSETILLLTLTCNWLTGQVLTEGSCKLCEVQ